MSVQKSPGLHGEERGVRRPIFKVLVIGWNSDSQESQKPSTFANMSPYLSKVHTASGTGKGSLHKTKIHQSVPTKRHRAKEPPHPALRIPGAKKRPRQKKVQSSSPEETRASKSVQGESPNTQTREKPTDHHLPTESHSAHGRATQLLMKSPTSFGRPQLETETERGTEEDRGREGNRIMIILLWNELVLVCPEAKPSVISSIKWGGRCPSSSIVVEGKKHYSQKNPGSTTY